MINFAFGKSTPPGRGNYWSAFMLLTLGTLSGSDALAQDADLPNAIACSSDQKKCSEGVSKKTSKRVPLPSYIDSASSAPLRPIPRYATSVDDKLFISECVVAGMRGIGGAAMSSTVRAACENKAKALQQDRELKNLAEYGASVSEREVEVVSVRTAGTFSDRLAVVNVAGKPNVVVTYLSVNVTSKTKGGECAGESLRLAYKIALPSKKSVVLQVPELAPTESPGLCVMVVTVKAKPADWSDSWKNLTTFGEIAPLKLDPFP